MTDRMRDPQLAHERAARGRTVEIRADHAGRMAFGIQHERGRFVGRRALLRDRGRSRGVDGQLSVRPLAARIGLAQRGGAQFAIHAALIRGNTTNSQGRTHAGTAPFGQQAVSFNRKRGMSQIVIFERLRNVVDKHDIERNFALMRQRSNIRRSVDGTCRAKTGVNVMGSISRRVRSPRTSCAHGSDWSRRSVLMQSVRSERVGKTCARIGGGHRLAPARTASFDIDRAVERSNVSTRAPRFIRFGHGAPASPIVQYLHRGTLRTAEKISRRSEDQIIPIIDPPDQYAAASLAQAYLSDNDYRNPLPMRRRRTTISTRLSRLLDMHACRRRTSTFRRVLNFKDSRRFFRFRH